MYSLHLSLTPSNFLYYLTWKHVSHYFTPSPFFLSLSWKPSYSLSYASQHCALIFSPRPTSLSLYFAGSQGALYPPDTIPSIHITSRDSDTNYLKGPLGCTTPWSRGWRENRDRWTESWEKYEGHLSLD